jgi:hypothetical protein
VRGQIWCGKVESEIRSCEREIESCESIEHEAEAFEGKVESCVCKVHSVRQGAVERGFAAALQESGEARCESRNAVHSDNEELR